MRGRGLPTLCRNHRLLKMPRLRCDTIPVKRRISLCVWGQLGHVGNFSLGGFPMSDRQAIIRAFMVNLIRKAGGVDAAAMLIGADLGAPVSKGSISKRQAGYLDWPLVEIMALEDALLDYSCREWFAQTTPKAAADQNLMHSVGRMAAESGEAMAAAMEFASGHGSRALALKEAHDALLSASNLVAQLTGGGAA